MHGKWRVNGVLNEMAVDGFTLIDINHFMNFNITNFLKLHIELEIWRVCLFCSNRSQGYCFGLVCGDKGFKFTVYKQKGA